VQLIAISLTEVEVVVNPKADETSMKEEKVARQSPFFLSELKVEIKRQGQVAVLVECRGMTCWVGRDLGPQPLG